MTHLTIRNLPATVADALDHERAARGTSLNRTVIDLLIRALGLDAEQGYDNGLGRLAGTWSQEDLEEFERAVAPFEEIDAELWR